MLLVVVALLAWGDRRLVAVPLMLQYVLAGVLLSPDISQPLFLIRVTLGIAVSVIVHITGRHMVHVLMAEGPLRAERGTAAQPKARRDMGELFRVVALLWSLLMAFGLWHAYPLTGIPPMLAFAALALLLVGATLALVSSDPLFVGVGALVLLAGFEIFYLSFETSLLVVALLGALDILLALVVSYSCERWVEASLQEARS